MLRKCCNAAAGRHPQACVGSQQHRQQAQLPQSPPCSLQQLGPGFHSPECAKVTGSANDSSHPSPGWGAAPSLCSAPASESGDSEEEAEQGEKRQTGEWVGAEEGRSRRGGDANMLTLSLCRSVHLAGCS